MKTLLLILITITAQAQFKKDIPSLSLGFLAGAADGAAESLKWHYDKVDAKFHLNDQYWNPKISYVNKYNSNLPGSTTYMVWTTDGYHMLRAVRNMSITGSVVFHPMVKKKWYFYAMDFVLHCLVYNAGFTLTYNLSK